MFDLLVLFALAILVSTIICYHIVDTINNKLSNIAINIPTPVCPQPRIIIRSRSGDREIISAQVDSMNNSMNNSLNNSTNNSTNNSLNNSLNNNMNSIKSTQSNQSNKLYEGFAESVIYPDADYIVEMSKKCDNMNKNAEQYQMRKVPGSNCKIPVYGTKTITNNMIGADGKFAQNNITMIVPQTFMGRDEFMEGTTTFNPIESNQANPINQSNLLGSPSKILQPYNEYPSY